MSSGRARIQPRVAWPHPSPYSRHHGNALKRIRLRKRGRNSCSWPEDLAVLRSQLRPKRLQTQGEPYQDPRAALRENRVIHPEVCTDFRGTSESSLCNTAGGPSPAPISNLRRSCSNRTRGVRTGFRQTDRPTVQHREPGNEARVCGQATCDEAATAVRGGQDGLFNRWGWDQGHPRAKERTRVPHAIYKS